MDKIKEALSLACETKALEIGPGTVTLTAEMFRDLFPGKRAVIVADGNTWRAAGETAHGILTKAGIPQDAPVIFTEADLHGEWRFVQRLDAVLAGTDAIPVAVGSGVINDLAKLCSHHNSRRYMIVGTAASMDGYTSYGASITKDGNKRTFPCPAPLGVIFDTTVAAAAPPELTASGYADLMAKIPGGADWMISDAVGTEKLVDFAFGMVQDGLKDALADPEGVRSGDPGKIGRLAGGLILSGFAMQAISSSRPASGAEHMFSHLWDMEGLNVDGRPFSHGFQVGIGTLATTAFLELMVRTPAEEINVGAAVAAWKTWEETEGDIRRIFAGRQDLVTRCLEETKAKYLDRDALGEQLQRLKAAWPELTGRIGKQILPLDEVRSRLAAVGAPYEPEHIGLSRKAFRESFLKLPYMRARFSVMDVASRCGWMEKWTDALFGKGGRWEIT